MNRTSRRGFLQAAGAATMGAALPAPAPLKISVFSKHLHFLGWQAMAEAAKEIGFDGVDLTMRKGGHVEPERAEQDLPKAAEAIRKAGLELPMITAGIVDAETPHVEAMLRAMQAVGVKRYRWGGFKWDEARPLPAQLDGFRARAARLADLNRKYDLCAMYHTHSGAEVGASFWDLWLILKDLDPTRVSVNLDVAHAVIEGGLGAWVRSVQLLAPLARGVAIKDFAWERNARGEWRPQWRPLGEGMVDFKRFFPLLRAANFNGPLQLHYEYPLGGADKGAPTITIDKSLVFDAMKRDLTRLRGWLK
ncbi:MAG: sugar phosphate isomerase/epimerase family protein [Blastocatellia bacterium]|nr:sugar phosphate isomerase/epimerase family protein [Blastocatellia bacterium]